MFYQNEDVVFDGIKATAKKLKNSLSSFDFELNDKFCDAGEPKAWENK